jgi:PAS domain S-box-containing protein
MNESAFKRLLLRFSLLPVLILCAFVSVISYQIEQITVQRQQATQATAIILQCDKLLNSLVDEETGVRGFVISGDRGFLEPYQRAVERIDGELNGLAELADGSASLQAEFGGIRDGFTRFTEVNRAMAQASSTDRSSVAMLSRQKQAMDSLRGRLKRITEEQTEVRETGRQKLAKMYAALPVIAVVGGIIVAICLVFDGIVQFRRISRAFGAQISEIELQRNSLHTTLQSIGDAVVVCDATGVITIFNPTAEQVTGWNARDAVGEQLDQVFSIVNEYTRQIVESPVDKVLRTGRVVGLANHTILIRKDGSEISIDDSGAPIRDDKQQIVGVVLVFRDIQARRVAERELALRSAELESLLQNSPAGFASFDREYRYVRVNKALAAMDSVSEEGHLGKTLAEVVPASAAIFEPILDQVFREKVVVHREFSGPAEDAPGVARQWLMWFYPVITGESKEPVLAGAIVLDTTERFHAQEALVRTEKLAAVGRLAASIAHEMNNPLTSVTNLLYLIGIDPTLNETTRGFVDRANIELDRVSRIATQTLRFARRTVAPALINLEEIINGVVLIFGGRLTQNRVRVDVRKRVVSDFYGYSSEVMQLLTNLIGNALDAIGEKGRIVVAIQNSRDWRTGKPSVAVTVADSGPGIPAAIRRKIWEPFFTTKSETGTGLGLWLVVETARKNGGSISLRTADEPERHGAVFRLLLPLRAPAANEPAAV